MYCFVEYKYPMLQLRAVIYSICIIISLLLGSITIRLNDLSESRSQNAFSLRLESRLIAERIDGERARRGTFRARQLVLFHGQPVHSINPRLLRRATGKRRYHCRVDGTRQPKISCYRGSAVYVASPQIYAITSRRLQLSRVLPLIDTVIIDSTSFP